MATADGRRIETRFLQAPAANDSRAGTFDFPEERPTAADWDYWQRFWGAFSRRNGTLKCPLEKWLHPTHRRWLWFFNSDEGVLERVMDRGVDYYLPVGGPLGRTRSGTVYRLAASHSDGREPVGQPCSVEDVISGGYRPMATGPPMAEGPSQPDRFFEFLRQWGGEWMWSDINNEGKDLRWVVQAIASGTAIWATDGSYNRELAPSVSGAGWVLY